MANQYIMTGLVQIKINDVKYQIGNTDGGKVLTRATTGQIVAEVKDGSVYVYDETIIVPPIDYTNGILKVNFT